MSTTKSFVNRVFLLFSVYRGFPSMLKSEWSSLLLYLALLFLFACFAQFQVLFLYCIALFCYYHLEEALLLFNEKQKKKWNQMGEEV